MVMEQISALGYVYRTTSFPTIRDLHCQRLLVLKKSLPVTAILVVRKAVVSDVTQQSNEKVKLRYILRQ